MQLPLPVAVLHQDGGVDLVNPRFIAEIGVEALASSAFQERLKGATKAPFRVAVPDRQGEETDLEVFPLPVANLFLLIATGGAEGARLFELQQELSELERISATDRLTGAWNRRQLERTIEAEISRVARHRQSLSLIFIDIDHFKLLNDTFGHQAGDEVLIALVQRLQEELRPSDSLYRWGGEEFWVLAPATGYRAASALAERLRSSVDQDGFPRVGRVTISAGVAEYLPGEDTKAWFERADRMVYRAKNEGRNRVSTDPTGGSDLWARDQQAMPLELVWLEGYECGEPTIDDEHRELFRLANVLIAASMQPKAEDDRVLRAVDALLGHVTKHFQDEERILEDHQYEGLEGHRMAHKALLQRAGELRDEVAAGNVEVGKVVEFLAVDVVSRHLLTADRKFFPLFAQPQDAA